MFLLKILAKAAISLALLSAAVGIISASGCGSYIPHEPETPDIEQPDENPGTEPEEPDEPEQPEISYAYGSIEIIETLGEPALYQFTGELNAVHIVLEHMCSTLLLAIAPGDEQPFAAGTSVEITAVNAGQTSLTWYMLYTDGDTADEQITFKNGKAAVTFKSDGQIACLIEGTANNYAVDLTVTITT